MEGLGSRPAGTERAGVGNSPPTGTRAWFLSRPGGPGRVTALAYPDTVAESSRLFIHRRSRRRLSHFREPEPPISHDLCLQHRRGQIGSLAKVQSETYQKAVKSLGDNYLINQYQMVGKK